MQRLIKCVKLTCRKSLKLTLYYKNYFSNYINSNIKCDVFEDRFKKFVSQNKPYLMSKYMAYLYYFVNNKKIVIKGKPSLK